MSVIQDPMLDRLNQLRSDKSGATVLAEMAADVVDEFVTAQAPQEPREFSANLEALLGRVVLAQPSMAVMLDLVQRVLVCFRDDLPFPMMKQRVQEALAEFRREQCRSMEALCEQALTISIPCHCVDVLQQCDCDGRVMPRACTRASRSSAAERGAPGL